MLKILILLHLGICFASGQAGNINPNKIQKGSTLSISIKGVPTDEQSQVNGNYHVGASGQIKLPLTGTLVMVNGLTNDQLERKIEAIYKKAKIYKEPVIEIIVNGKDDPTPQTISVGGHVKRSGQIRWTASMTLLQAIQGAGDKTQFGSKYVYLYRNQRKYKLNTKLLEHQNTKVLPNDTIEVLQVGPFGDR